MKNEQGLIVDNKQVCFLRNKGFTLVELLLYIGILFTVILSISIMYALVLQVRVKNQTVSEVEGQGTMMMQIITQTLRNSVSITLPAIGSSSASLTLTVVDPAKNPTVFDLSDTALRIKEGSASAVTLTSSAVTVSNLSFQNLSATGSIGTIRTQFTVTAVNNSGRNEYDFTKTTTDSASLRF